MPREKAAIAVYGATGFTGRYVALEVAAQAESVGGRVLLAGRNRERLEAVAAQVRTALKSSRQGENIEVDVMVADVSDPASVKEMVSEARVLINCVGPFRKYGEIVVRTCVEVGTDYVDVCGEPEFMEGMLLRYGDAARSAGVVIISACGFDSIPAG